MTRRESLGASAVAVAFGLLASGCALLAGEKSDSGTTVANNSSAPVILREYSFGDGPETTSKLIDIQPGDEASVPCGYLREYRLEDESGLVLPNLVLCSTEGTVVVTDQDLKAAS